VNRLARIDGAHAATDIYHDHAEAERSADRPRPITSIVFVAVIAVVRLGVSVWSGATAVSLLLFVLGMAYLYLLAREFLTADESTTALWMLAAYPFALFYGAIYTESLFLVGTAGAFYHFRRDQLGRAALWGLAVGLTRPNGFFLCVPLGSYLMCFRFIQVAWAFLRTGELPHHDAAHVEGIDEAPVDRSAGAKGFAP